MSYYQQQNKHKISIGQDGNALTMLIAMNLVAFVILAFIKVVYYFTSSSGEAAALFDKNIFDWVILPADFHKFLTRPWTLFTQMFVYDTKNIWYILGNLIWLGVFGYILQDLSGNKKIFPIFLYGALAGAVAFMAAFNLIPSLRENVSVAQLYGSSAGIMAIAVATTTLAPNYRVFRMLNGGIPIWIITVIYLIIDLATIPLNNPGEYIAHITGGLTGFWFMMRLEKGHDLGAWMNNLYDWFNDLFDPEKPKKGKVVKSQLFYKAKIQPFKKTPHVTQQRVDEILDKIAQKGYNTLSDEEKEILKRASQEDLS